MEFTEPNLPPRKQPAGFTTPGGGGAQFTTTLPDRPKLRDRTRVRRRADVTHLRETTADLNQKTKEKEKRAWPAARSVSPRTHVVGSESRKPVSFRGPGSKTGRPQVDCATPTVVNGGTQSLSPGTEARPVQTDTGEGGGFPLV